jgi:dipeptidyl aminopeptidase/acylaminoacyl peptidase
MRYKRLSLFLLLLITACVPSQSEIAILANTATSASATPTPFQPQAATRTPLVFPTLTATLPAPSMIPNPLEKYTIASMRARIYGIGTIQLLEKISDEGRFTRYKFQYSSDGIPIYGFVNIPKGEGPFPVIIAIHGNYDTRNYQLMPYSTLFADRIAQEGYIVFHPNMRNFGESGSGDDRYRNGLTTDILNLIAMIQSQGGIGDLSMMRPDKIGLWGHSMGGEVALRVITISDDIDATMLYAPMSGDVSKNAVYINAQDELDTPPHLLAAISPHHSYGLITSPLKLYHGTADEVVPILWSKETCATLTMLGKEINCAFYEGAKHTFNNNYTADFERSYFYFFETHLK